MLQDIRAASRSGWTYIMVGVLIVVFAVFFGAPLDSCGGAKNRLLVAKVGGTDLYTDDVNIIYNRTFGGQRTAEESQLTTQQSASLRALLLIHIMADRAEKAGLRVSEEEFKSYIKDPLNNFEFLYAYGQSGGFDGPFYKAYVQNQLRAPLTKYEAFKRRELLARKYMSLLEMQIQAAEWEVADLHKVRNNSVTFDYIKLDPERIMASMEANEADVAAFLAANEEKISKYYADNKTKYEDAEEVRLRRIFILKPGESEGDDQIAAAKTKIETARKRIETEDFATVAGEMTEDFAKDKQGLMDWSTLENLDQAIADAIKDAKPGDVRPVETNFAYMLVKLEERKEAKVTALSEVQTEIATELLKAEKVETELLRLSQLVMEAARTHETLEAALDSLRPVADAEGNRPPSVWDSVAVATAQDVTLEGQDLSALLGRPMPGLGRPWDMIPGIGKSSELALDLFKLTEEKPLGEKVYRVTGSPVIVRLKSRQQATPEKLEEDRAELEMEIRGIKVSQLLGPWPALFSRPVSNFGEPVQKYGPLLEAMLTESLADKSLRLYEKNYPAALRITTEPEEAPGIQPFTL